MNEENEMTAVSKDELKGLVTANSFSGLATFFRRHHGSAYETADVVVYGLPFDLGVSNRPGSRFGPRAIREASLQLAWGKVWPWGIDPFETLAVLDAGDIQYQYGCQDEFCLAAETQAKRIAEAEAVPFSLGGDHGVTLSTLKGLTDVTGPVALLDFDAHTDTSEGPEIQHGTMFRHATRSGIVVANNSVQIGIRTNYISDDGYLRIHAPEAVEQSPATIAKTICDRIGDMPVYISFDIDCLDPAYAPGTGTPTPGGLSTLRILEIFRALGNTPDVGAINIVGVDIVEVAPCYDVAQITSLAAAQIAHEILCLIACINNRKPALIRG